MRRLTLMLVGTMSMGSAGVFALACSSDPAVVEPGDDDDDDDDVSSSGNASSSGNTSGGSGSTSSSSGSSSGGCFAQLRPAPDNGPFCPFVAKSGSSGTGVSCATGEKCCAGRPMAGGSGFDPSACVDQDNDCAAPSDPEESAEYYECTETDDCPSDGNTGDGGSGGSGQRVCCVIPNPADEQSSIAEDVNQFGCTYAKGEYGTRCKSACGARELQGCQSDADCSDGKACSLLSVGGGDRIYMGVCK